MDWTGIYKGQLRVYRFAKILSWKECNEMGFLSQLSSLCSPHTCSFCVAMLESCWWRPFHIFGQKEGQQQQIWCHHFSYYWLPAKFCIMLRNTIMVRWGQIRRLSGVISQFKLKSCVLQHCPDETLLVSQFPSCSFEVAFHDCLDQFSMVLSIDCVSLLKIFSKHNAFYLDPRNWGHRLLCWWNNHGPLWRRWRRVPLHGLSLYLKLNVMNLTLTPGQETLEEACLKQCHISMWWDWPDRLWAGCHKLLQSPNRNLDHAQVHSAGYSQLPHGVCQ